MAAGRRTEDTTTVDLGELLDAEDGAVVTLVAGETRLAAYRAVLAARSPVFAAMFQYDTLEASSGEVRIPDVEGPVLRQLLTYMYTEQLPKLPSMAPELLAAADKYGLVELKARCERQLAAQLTTENAAVAAVVAVRHSCLRLAEVAVAFIRANPQVLATQGWADAVYTQPADVAEVVRLLTGAPAGSTSATTTGGSPNPGTHRQPCGDCSQTPDTAADPTDACITPPFQYVAFFYYRNLSAEEKTERLRPAAKWGAVKEVQELLALGADVRSTDRWGWTALHFAVLEGHVEVVRCLLGAGAEAATRDRWGSTPLHLATCWGHAAVVWLLVVASAALDARDEWGLTPLHWAAMNGHSQAAAALLEAGADSEVRDMEGNTPLDLATQFNKQQVIQMLA